MHIDQITSRNGLLTIVQIALGVALFSLAYHLLGEPVRWMQMTSFFFYANGALILISLVLSGAGTEGTFYFKVYHFVALVLYIGIPVWSIVNNDAKSNDKGKYWGTVALSFLAAFIHGTHGVFNLRS
ncbi:uncharacterized protein LOC111263233 [Varroa jacobsoni]|uniref:Uncharacterized protein n=1 Tax=Varroa destructor TaxID=109461 RepID=A0A7M7KDK3_VARDE|nr:uncharacterized protein LOC111250595 [Varroa destructor]XP_022693892.1 uncharacterized protein LOC111263233 [Varroa jacobsoni]